MSMQQQQEVVPGTEPARPPRRGGSLITTGIVTLGIYWMICRGSVGGGAGGVTGDGQWTDADGAVTTIPPETFLVTLGPSPLIAILVIALLAVAWWTRDGDPRRAWLSPSLEMAAIVIPILAIVGVWLWIQGFGHDWRLGVPIETPWWTSATVTIDRMR